MSASRLFFSKAPVEPFVSSRLARWIVAIIIVTAVANAGIAGIYVHQQHNIHRIKTIADTIHHGRIDLAKGFLHLSQDGGHGSPFDRSKGLALINQSISSLERSIGDLGLGDAARWENFDKSLRSFRSRLAEASKSGADTQTQQVSMRLAFNELEEQVVLLDNFAQAHYNKVSSEVFREFFIVLCMAALLLAITSFIIIHTSRTIKVYDVALEEGQLFAGDVINSITANIAVLDRNGDIIAVNEAWMQFARENDCPERDAYVGTNYLKVCEEAHRRDGDELAAQVMQSIQSVLEGTETTFSIEYPCHSPNKERWFYMRAARLRGKGTGVVITHADITGRKRAEEEIKAINVFLDRVIDMAPFAMWISDKKGTVIRVNRSLCESINLTEDNIVGKYNVFNDVNLKNQGIMTTVQRAFEEHETVRFGVFWKAAEAGHDDLRGGHDMHIDVSMFPILDSKGELLYVVCQWVDITELKHAEQALKKSAHQYRLLAQNTSDWIFFFDKDFNITYSSPSVENLTGYTAEEFIGNRDKFLEIVHPDDRPMVEEHRQHDSLCLDKTEIEYRIFHKDGSVRWIGHICKSVFDENGQYVGRQGANRDISARKQVEESLRRSEEHYRLIADNTADTITLLDMNLKRTYVSPSIFRLRGYTVAETMSHSLAEALTPASLIEVNRIMEEEMAREAAGNAPPDRSQTVELEQFCKDGSTIWAETTLSFIRDKEGKPLSILAVSRNISERKHAQEALIKSEARYKRIISTAKEGIAMTDENHRIVFVNTSMVEMTGYGEEELLGHNMLTMIFPEDVPEHREKMRQRREGATDVYERRFRRKDGRELWTIVSASPILDEQQRFQGSFAMFTDITLRKKTERDLEEERRSLERRVAERTAELTQANLLAEDLYNNAPCGYHSLSTDGVVVYINDTELGWLGYSREEVVGKTKFTEWLTPESLEHFQKNFPVFKQQGFIRDLEFNLVRKDGTILPVLISATAVLDKEGYYLMSRSTVIDYTSQQNAAKELKEANLTLVRASKMKEQFLSTMSHEIRTPLNAIVMLNHLLADSGLTLKQQQLVRKMDLSSRNLLGIVSDILDFSKIEAGRIDLETIPFDLDEVLDNLSNLATVKAQEKDLEMVFLVDEYVPHHLVGDPIRLGQVLHNLAGNAVKFTESGEIVISVAALKCEDGSVELEFRVQDTGIGMDRKELEHVFQPFTQADASTTRRYGGTGLGLAISKSLVSLMGGTLTAESEPGAGSIFRFTALFGLQEKKEYVERTAPQRIQGMRVLVADDKESLRRFIAGTLKHFSLETTTVETGAEAIEEAGRAHDRKQPYGLILLDYGMPNMNGMEAARRIKNIAALSRIPILLMVTNPIGNAEIQKALERGIVFLLTKPVSRSTLFDAIITVFAEPERKPATIEKKPAGRFDHARILLVEDNEINQDIVRTLLEDADMDVSTASNGEEAVTAFMHAREKPFDLILMDIRMPLMDGYQATREIRSHDPSYRAPIIAMTAEAIAGTAEKILQAGMNDYITKPIDPERLLNRISYWLRPERSEPGRDRQTVPPAASSLDVQEGLSRVRGDRALYRRLLAKFKKDHSGFLEKVRAGIDTLDYDGVAATLHGMKGLAGNIGATRLFDQVTKMEKAIRSNERSPNEVQNMLEGLTSAFQALVGDISAFEETTEQEKPVELPQESPTREVMEETLATMAGYLEESDARAADYMSVFRKVFRDSVYFSTVQEIETNVSHYDYQKALAVLHALKGTIEHQEGK